LCARLQVVGQFVGLRQLGATDEDRDQALDQGIGQAAGIPASIATPIAQENPHQTPLMQASPPI
jgi:hypothetical protein